MFSNTASSPVSNFLSPEEKIIIGNALAQLRHTSAFTEVKLIARIIGSEHDYFVARGCGLDPLLNARLFYSVNGQDWTALPAASALKAATRQQVEQATSYFVGNPAFEFDQTSFKSPPNKRNATAEERQQSRFRVVELDRLAHLAQCLEEECHVVPRGAYLCRPDGTIRANTTFCGLSWTEATKLDHYLLFRLPLTYLPSHAQLEMGADALRDFLKPLSREVSPLLLDQAHRTKWNLKQHAVDGLITIQSLEWPGFLFYHRPATSEFVHFYCGTGLRNRDFPFQIPPPVNISCHPVTPPPALVIRQKFDEIQPTAEQQAESERLKEAVVAAVVAAAALPMQ